MEHIHSHIMESRKPGEEFQRSTIFLGQLKQKQRNVHGVQQFKRQAGSLVKKSSRGIVGLEANNEWEVETIAQDSFRSSSVKEGERTVGWAKWRKGFIFLFCHHYFFYKSLLLNVQQVPKQHFILAIGDNRYYGRESC